MASLREFRGPRDVEELEAAAEALSSLADDILNLLEVQVKTTNMSANEFSK